MAASLFLFALHFTNGQIESPSFPSDAPTARPVSSVDAPSSIESALLGKMLQPPGTELIDLDQFSLPEFEEAVESSKPDNVDNDAIQELIDQFLDKGTFEHDKNKKINVEAQKLVGSSPYWETSGLKVCSSKNLNNSTSDHPITRSFRRSTAL